MKRTKKELAKAMVATTTMDNVPLSRNKPLNSAELEKFLPQGKMTPSEYRNKVVEKAENDMLEILRDDEGYDRKTMNELAIRGQIFDPRAWRELLLSVLREDSNDPQAITKFAKKGNI